MTDFQREALKVTETAMEAILRASASLVVDCRQWIAVPGIAEIMNRLAKAQATVNSESYSDRPLVVAFLGGTGVGKSTLFNALLGEKFSPTSDVERCCTREPQAAVFCETRANAAFLEPLNPVWHVHQCDNWANVILIDTPDINGVFENNWNVAEDVFSFADVLIYVTDPERYADALPIDKLRELAPQKLWLFVMTKVRSVKELDKVVAQLDESLKKAGFPADDECRFLVDLVHNASADVVPIVERLQRKISADERQSMDERMRLAGFVYALDPSLLKGANTLAKKLAEHEEALTQELREVYRKGLVNPLVLRALQTYIRERLWHALAANVWGPIRVPLWMRARMTTLSAGFAVTRLLRGGAVGLLAAGGMTVYSAIRGTFPLRRVVDLIGHEFRSTIERIHRQEDQILISYQLSELAVSGDIISISPLSPKEPSDPVASMSIGPVSLKLQNLDLLSKLRTLFSGDELVEFLHADCERIALMATSRLMSWRSILAGNLLPMFMAGHILWRIGEAWLDRDYLSMNFFAMAVILFAASMLPGYILFSVRVRRFHEQPDPEEFVRSLEHPQATNRLRSVRNALEQLMSKIERLRCDIELMMNQVSPSIPFASVNITSSIDAA